MKLTDRTDFRVQVTLQARDLTVLGLEGLPGRINAFDNATDEQIEHHLTGEST